MATRKINKVHRQDGLAIVELTLTLPLLLLLLLVTMEFGRAFMQYNTLTKSVRDSVRYVASNALLGQTGTIQLNAQLVSEAQNLVAYGSIAAAGNTALIPGLSPGQVTVAAAGPEDISVLATYPYQPMFLVLSGFGLGPDRSSLYTFRAQATMRAL